MMFDKMKYTKEEIATAIRHVFNIFLIIVGLISGFAIISMFTYVLYLVWGPIVSGISIGFFIGLPAFIYWDILRTDT